MRGAGLWLSMGLAIGLLLGYLLGAPGQEDPGGASPPDAVPQDHPVSVDPGPMLLTAAPATADAQPVATKPSGSGLIQGRVQDAAGAPLAGVTVIASPQSVDPRWAPRPGGAPPTLQTPEGAAAAAHRRALSAARTSRRVKTDAGGRYRLDQLAGVPFTVQAWKVGYRIAVVSENRGWGVSPGATVNFKAEAVVTVHIQVRGVDGEPPERADITAYPSDKAKGGGRRSGWTPARPWLDLAPGSYEFEASTDGDRAARSARVPVLVEQGRAGRLVLELGGRPGLVGSLRLREPIVHQRTRVHALRLDDGEEAEPAALFDRARQRKGRKKRSRPERGRLNRERTGYTFKDLAPGRWLAGVSLDGRSCQAWTVVTITDRRVVHDFDIPAFDRGVFLEVRVIKRGGEPIPKVQLQHVFEAPQMSLGGGARQFALASGSYLIEREVTLPKLPPGRAIERLPEGTHTLTVHSRELGQTSVVFDPTHSGVLEVVLDATTTLALELSGRERLPAGSVVHLVDALPNESMGLQGTSSEIPSEGPITLEKAQPGARLLAFISHPADGRRRAVQIVVPVEIRVGDERLAVDIPPLRRLTITGLSRSSVSLRRLDPAGNWLQQIVFDKPDAAGRTVLEHVPDGRYEFGYTVPGERKTTWQPVEVRGKDVTVAVAP